MNKTEEFIDKATSIYGSKYDYSLVEYKNSNTKVKIICKVHGIFEQIPRSHLKHNCEKCKQEEKSCGIEEFIRKSKLIHEDRIDYQFVKYVNTYTKVKLMCNTHNIIFEQTPDSNIRSGSGCKQCIKEKYCNTNKFIQKCINKFGYKYDYSQVCYSGTNSIIKVICPEHGLFERKAYLFLLSGCSKCNMFLTQDEFIERSNLIHNNKYSYDKSIYVNTKEKLIITCKIHDDFSQKPNSHMNGQGCPTCGLNSVSHLENKWLDTLKISNENRQYKIELNNKKYIVDGFDPLTNTVYEFNGDFWHGNPNKYKSNDVNPKTKTTYGELYNKSCEKEKVLKEKFSLISIWESDYLKIQKKSF